MAEKLHSIAGKRSQSRNQYTTSPLSLADRSDRATSGRGPHASLLPGLQARPLPQAAEVAWRFALVCFLLVLCVSPPTQGADVDAVSVQRAIDRGIAYLRKAQNERGGWDEYPGQSCGKSALCTLALLNAGVSREDPDMIRAMKYLRSHEPRETYSVALQTLVFCQLGAAGDLPKIHRNVTWLADNQKNEGGPPSRVGSWDYGEGRGIGDPSNTQFALLALGAADDRGVEVDPKVFERSLDYWNATLRDGGWAYPGRNNSGSMTCAGIASVIIARGRLGSGSSQIDGDKIQCCGGADKTNWIQSKQELQLASR